MVKKVTIYDRATGAALTRNTLTANEAVQNDPDRYRRKAWSPKEVEDFNKKIAKADDPEPAVAPKPAKPKGNAKPAAETEDGEGDQTEQT